mmetsp:Transcript_4917/g.17248  ORF Transcript_4917/g.17248 Transcript_4917/m.17248 type:complete len:381 (-) Transcript_4917:424-1566(-)
MLLKVLSVFFQQVVYNGDPHGVPLHVHHRPQPVQEPVYRHHEGDVRGELAQAHGLQDHQHGDEPRAGNGGCSHGGHGSRHHHDKGLCHGERHPVPLRDEDHGERLVQRRTVHVDRGAERQHEVRDGVLHPLPLGAPQGHGERRGGGVGAKRGDKAWRVGPQQRHRRAPSRGGVQAGQHDEGLDPQPQDDGDDVQGDGLGHGSHITSIRDGSRDERQDPDRGETEHVLDHPRHQLQQGVQQGGHPPRALVLARGLGHDRAEKNREGDHPQDVHPRRGVHDVPREGLLQYAEDGLQRVLVVLGVVRDVRSPVAVATLLSGSGVLPRPKKVDDHDPNEHGGGGGQKVVPQGKPAHPPCGPLVLAQRAHSLHNRQGQQRQHEEL